jgi:hypothetical protein
LTAAYYPIILFAFNRPWHTEQVLNALQKNELAEKSDLFIYVDGHRGNASQKEVKAVEDVRKLVSGKRWCKTVNIKIAEKNIGCRNSIINGISEVLCRHEAVIVLEDDVITSPFFLRFMNLALQYYQNRQSVFSISGYNFPNKTLPIPNDYPYDVFVSLRQLSWGWGTWRNRWQQVDWRKSSMGKLLLNKQQVEAFNRGGEDLSRMIVEELKGQSDAWDIQFTHAHFMNHAVSIVPCKSYTRNIGLDDSGTHTINRQSESLENDLSLCVKDPLFLDTLYQDKRIINLFCSVYYPEKRPLWKKAVNRVSRMLGGKNVFTVKKKVYD